MGYCLGFKTLRSLFSVLGCLMLATLIYTLFIDGSPFRKELLYQWMVTTLIDFYITVVPIAAWVAYKEPSWINAGIWIVLLVCFGSVTTCGYIVLQLLKLSSEDSFLDPMYYLLMGKDDKERKTKFASVIAARILFGALGCLMVGTLIYTLSTDGSPFRKELLTSWMTALLIDFYINIVAISVWIAYKESSWISAFIWIVLLICFGSITTCIYIVVQLLRLSYQDPIYHVLLDSRSRQMKTRKISSVKSSAFSSNWGFSCLQLVNLRIRRSIS